MSYKLIAYSDMIGKSNYVLEQLKIIAENYIKSYQNNKLKLSVKLDSVSYCPNFMFYDKAVWIVEIEEKILKNTYTIFNTILISDKTGKIYETFVNMSKTNGNTILNSNEIIAIANAYKNDLEQKQKFKFHYYVAINNISYDMCFKNKKNAYEPSWFVLIVCEEMKIFSDPCHYVFISDISGEIIAIMNHHGRMLDPSEI
ncbi:MAG: hypothetical protein K2G88_07155 [Oscillospiraceae bacterium]|nr:hypothetical protein [Oscillospiraceae bacterium]